MNKEAVIVVLDCNRSMGKAFADDKPREGQEPRSRFENALDSIKMLLEQKLLYSPTHDVGMVCYGTKDTQNYINDKNHDKAQGVTTERSLSKVDLEFFRSVEKLLPEEDQVEQGDMVDGLIVAMDMLTRHCGTKKYRKRIFLITDGEKKTNTNQREMASLVELMAKNDVRLNAITFDFANDLADNDDESEEEEEQAMSEKKQTYKKDS